MRRIDPATVTVVLRTRNRPAMLRRALRSVLEQRHTRWRLSIVNDVGDLREVEDAVTRSGIDRERVAIVHNAVHQPRGRALNQGFAAWPGATYAAVHDDDDTWHPDFLARAVAHLERGKGGAHVAGVVSYTRVIKEKILGEEIIEIDRSREFDKDASLLFVKRHQQEEQKDYGAESIRTLGAVRLTDMLRYCLFTPISFVYEQRVFEEMGRYDESLDVAEDYDFVIRFLARYGIEIVPEYLANYHHRLFQECGEYTNATISAAQDITVQVNALASKWLIEDLAQGRFGVGVLMNLVKQNETIIDQNERILAYLRRLTM